MKVGIVTIQGSVEEHYKALREADPSVEIVEVKTPEDLTTVDRLILCGGESTVVGRMSTKRQAIRKQRVSLLEAIKSRIDEGMPVLGTCAGCVLLASEIDAGIAGKPPQERLGILPVKVTRNGYGRQQNSFEILLKTQATGDSPYPGVFIRAPIVTEVGEGVEVLAEYEHPVMIRKNNVLATTFHPELASDSRIHKYFLQM